ncbi:hypothetical protein KFE25_007387 [Diacronema lutheri]|uniref:Uncharacterized protein n=1 Tax=Diacronema lutheri TaxID=2081491 RepID=A0A8J5XR50_DIALT|nr:hypothetical protein KFE25_007387 [Diacronema lutheri]
MLVEAAATPPGRAHDEGVLSRLEDMLTAMRESGRREARFLRAVASLESILRTARERRSARAFRVWSARASEGAVNGELIFERGVLIDSFTRARLKGERASAATLHAARALALRACACQGRLSARAALRAWTRWALLSERDYFMQAAVRQIGASRAHSLALASSAFLVGHNSLALSAALCSWRRAVDLLGRVREQQQRVLSVHESVLAELRLRALRVLSCADALRTAHLARRLSRWRSAASAIGAAEIAIAQARHHVQAARRVCALVGCLAAREATNETRLLRALGQWGRTVRSRLAASLADERRAAQRHVRVALAASARWRAAAAECPARVADTAAAPRAAAMDGAAAADAPEPCAPVELHRPHAHNCSCARSPSAAASLDNGAASGAALDLSRAERKPQPSVGTPHESDALQLLLGVGARSARSPSAIGGSEALGAALREGHPPDLSRHFTL